ncbi:hypothetical protein IMZ48_07570, partial [Candidatus Bathyarchaeota archaeon]|nr:hypothetical protein [Candidatus Bathyarchaeota archaeon]
MASLNLMPDEVRVIEYVRQRLTQVVSSLQSFKDDVAIGQPLPPAYVPRPPSRARQP